MLQQSKNQTIIHLLKASETEHVLNTERGSRLMMMLDNGFGKAESCLKAQNSAFTSSLHHHCPSP